MMDVKCKHVLVVSISLYSEEFVVWQMKMTRAKSRTVTLVNFKQNVLFCDRPHYVLATSKKGTRTNPEATH